MDVEIRGHCGAGVHLQVLGYERADAELVSDANWLTCNVDLNVDGFSGNYQASFTTHDFTSFHNELRAALSSLSGTASFLTDEDALRLIVKVDATGRVDVEGIARTMDMPRACLSFTFESDQSYLGQTKSQLEAALREYPIKSA